MPPARRKPAKPPSRTPSAAQTRSGSSGTSVANAAAGSSKPIATLLRYGATFALTAFFLYRALGAFRSVPGGLSSLRQEPVQSTSQPTALPGNTEAQKALSYPDVLDEQFKKPVSPNEALRRKEAIREAFKTSWNAYERDAFGYDNFHPIGQSGSNLESTGIGYFIIDGLDSLQLLELDDEYARAREWIETDLSFDVDDKHHAFETTIRVLGGLLSAYHLSHGDKLYLDKAVDLADRILPIFDTPSGIPLSFINLQKREGIADKDNWNMSSVAEAGSLQLEFKYLSHLTGNPIYWDKVTKVMDVIRDADKTNGLVPLFLNPKHGRFDISEIRLGSRADSYYEYLLKQYLQTNRSEEQYGEMYDEAMSGIRQHLVITSPINNTVYTIELMPARAKNGDLGYRRVRKQDHLVCFFGGLLMLGITGGAPFSMDLIKSQVDERNWLLGEEITKTCMRTYTESATGLGAEIAYFYPNGEVAKKAGDASGRAWYIDKRRKATPRRPKPDPPIDARNILRPETVESLFVAWRLTHNPIYRQWGWFIFQAFEKHCKIPTGGYASIRDVDEVPVVHEDRMETFFLSETLKYLFLLYSDDDVLPLDQYVFNTEAHPFPVFTPTQYVDV